MSRGPRVLIFGCFRKDYARNITTQKGLARLGCELLLVHEPFWERIPDRYALILRPWLALWVFFVFGLVSSRLAWRGLRAPAVEAIFVGFPGAFDMPLAALLARWRRCPLIYDPLISYSDSLVDDRKLAAGRGVRAWALGLLDAISLRLATRVLVDTAEHGRFFAQRFGLGMERQILVPVGADDELYKPQPGILPEPGRILYYGEFTPLHGAEIIVEAFLLFAEARSDVRLRMIGRGQSLEAARALAKANPRIEFVEPVPEAQLPGELARAELCLGIFGASEKARRVVPHKVYQAMAAGRPVLTGISPASEALIAEGAVAGCAMNDARALSAELRRLMDDEKSRAELARRGLETFRQRFRPELVLAPVVDWIRVQRIDSSPKA